MAGGDRQPGADRRGDVGRGGGSDGETNCGRGIAEPDGGFGFEADQRLGQVAEVAEVAEVAKVIRGPERQPVA